MRKEIYLLAAAACMSLGAFQLARLNRTAPPGDLRDAPAESSARKRSERLPGDRALHAFPPGIIPPILPVPSSPEYTQKPLLGGWNNGLYRPYIPSLDTVQAVMLAPDDTHMDRRKGYGWMELSDVESAIAQTAAELTRMKVKVILVGAQGPSIRKTLAEIGKLGGNMRLVETFNKADRRGNQLWFRDYGLLPLKNIKTGKWENVDLLIKDAPLPDLSRYALERFGMQTFASLDVTATGGHLRGGNILVDEAGRCFSAGFKHPLFESVIKCAKTVTLPCRSEICHVDEYVTFLKNDTAVTNKEEFVPALREAGYKRVRLVPDDKHLSLANVLIVNGTVFLMYIDELKTQMSQAKAVFEAEGYRVVPVNSGGAGELYGAIHCLTKEIPE